eukprot:7375207-Pyramimonas_sp.AAC.1
MCDAYLADVDAQTAVDAAALDANEHAEVHRRPVRICEFAGAAGEFSGAGVNSQAQGAVWSSEDAQEPQHRPQTANQVVQYAKGVRDLSNDRRLPLT